MTILDRLTLSRLMTDLEQRGLADLTAFWQMSPAERIALATVAGALEVDCAIEIGTAQGGSLAAITKYAALTYSLELLPESSERLRARIPNAAFRVGDSRSTIPEVLREISSAGRHLDLVLVDGDHSRAGVRADIDAVLQYVPRRPMAMLMHDSFNPDCRFGMRDVAWSDYPHVHAVDLDFVAGNTIPQPDGRFEMWAGLALAVLMPAPRQRVLTIAARNEALFEQTFPHSAHAAAFSDATPGRITTAPAESWYQAFASAGEDRLQRFLEGIHRGGDPEPADFAPIRARLAPLVAQWRSRAARVAVYGAGTHTKALLGLVPEVFPLVSCFIDRQGSGSFLGRPRVSPSAFSADSAEVVLYSSPQHEAAMFASLSSQPVEHVRLYA